jgi:hypothetical protein
MSRKEEERKIKIKKEEDLNEITKLRLQYH